MTVAVTGMGTVNSIASDAPSFAAALREGRCGIAPLTLPGAPVGVAARVVDWQWPRHKALKNATKSVRLSATAASEAIAQSGIDSAGFDRSRVGIVVAGSNLHQQSIAEAVAKFNEAPEWLNPRYALSFLDTSQVGVLTEMFSIHGMSYTVGGASASGNVALLHGYQWIRSGVLDACVVVGASSDLSAVELQAFAAIGAASPSGCRPFDSSRDGFVWGEGSGCVVLESVESAARRGVPVLAEIAGGAMFMDGNHLSDSSAAGEECAMRDALTSAGVAAANVDYLNAHGTASRMGDETECAAIRSLFGDNASRVWVNSTKSLIGHCLSAAGVIEAVASILQMNGGFVHPNLGLNDPIDRSIRFAGASASEAAISTVLSNSFGFGGFNSSVVLRSAA